MPIIELFSKRQNKLTKGDDVFQYDTLPLEFRRQVIHIWVDAIGAWYDANAYLAIPREHKPNDWWLSIFKMFTREKGVFDLSDRTHNPFVQCQEYLMQAETTDALDLIELTFRYINLAICYDAEARHTYDLVNPADAIEELNGRFREHGIGYEFTNNDIIRVDSKFIHAEVVKPALQLLHDAGKSFSGPLQEFMDAHAHYRKGENKEAIHAACKAFESTLKAICTARNWPFDPQKATAKLLLDIVFTQGLFPEYLQGQFSSLRSLLESGVPTIRNKSSAGHGQGPLPISVPQHLTAYTLHLTASSIVLLIEAHQRMR